MKKSQIISRKTKATMPELDKKFLLVNELLDIQAKKMEFKDGYHRKDYLKKEFDSLMRISLEEIQKRLDILKGSSSWTPKPLSYYETDGTPIEVIKNNKTVLRGVYSDGGKTIALDNGRVIASNDI